jgi:hypothetical protein
MSTTPSGRGLAPSILEHGHRLLHRRAAHPLAAQQRPERVRPHRRVEQVELLPAHLGGAPVVIARCFEQLTELAQKAIQAFELIAHGCGDYLASAAPRLGLYASSLDDRS